VVVYAKLRAAIAFTRSLHEQGAMLEQARQPHIDAWLGNHPVPTRAFLDWRTTPA
jgi:hypothetical protein